MASHDSGYHARAQQAAGRGGVRRKEVFLLALTVLVATLIAALACELALRVGGYTPLYFNPLNAFHEPHPLVGYRGRPNFVGRFRKPDFDVTIAQNENGFRRVEHQSRRSSSRMGLFVFGDSFTWGWGVGQGHVFTDLVSRALPDVYVANFGLDGSGTVQQFALFEAYARDRLRPGDVVLLMFYSNDFSDNVSGRLRAEVRDGRVVLAGPARQLSFRPSDLVEESSYLVNLVFFSANRLKAWVRRNWAERRATRLVELGDRAPEIAVLKHYLAAFRDACRERQARFIAGYIPEQAELGEAPHADQNRLRNDRAFRRAFFECAASLSVPTIDFLPAFLSAQRKEPPGWRLTFPSDAHWNEHGHEVAARVIVRFLSAVSAGPGV